MNLVRDYLRELFAAVVAGWNRFWFTPADPATLGLIRLLAGLLLFYTHLVWSLDLEGFFGPQGWLPSAAQDAAYGAEDRALFWSHLYHIHSTTVLWVAHVAALVIFAMFAAGVFSRVTSVLAWLLTVSYAHRVMPTALFGLDDINAMLAMYLMIGPSGACFSVDAWLARRQGRGGECGRRERVGEYSDSPDAASHVRNLFVFSPRKAMGETWWNGSAMWLAFANYEYQSIDMTWLAAYPVLLSLIAHVTVAWELSYPALVWPRLTRPLVVALSIPIHLGIGVFLGMMTFGLVMIIANLAFVSPWVVRAVFNGKDRRPAGGNIRSGTPDRTPFRVEVSSPPRILTIQRRFAEFQGEIACTSRLPSSAPRAPWAESSCNCSKSGDFPFREIKFLASGRSAGKPITFNGRQHTIEELRPDAFDGIDLAIGSTPDEMARDFAPWAVERGCTVVDESGYWRMEPDVPLVIPEVNAARDRDHKGIIASPNCSTTQMVVAIKPLHDAARVRRVVVSTYQATSGAGLSGCRDLEQGTHSQAARRANTSTRRSPIRSPSTSFRRSARRKSRATRRKR